MIEIVHEDTSHQLPWPTNQTKVLVGPSASRLLPITSMAVLGYDPLDRHKTTVFSLQTMSPSIRWNYFLSSGSHLKELLQIFPTLLQVSWGSFADCIACAGIESCTWWTLEHACNNIPNFIPLTLAEKCLRALISAQIRHSSADFVNKLLIDIQG